MAKKTLVSIIFIGVFTFILTGCTKDKEEPREDQEASNSVEEEHISSDERNPDNTPLSSFLLLHNQTAEFKEDGDEFASLTLTSHQLDDRHIAIDEDNGGSLVRRVFKIEQNRIVIISEKFIEPGEPLPSIDSLAGSSAQYIFLEKPIKVGHSFGGWTIAEVNATVDTPYETFDNAIKLEMVDHGYKTITYIVPKFGEVLRESIIENEEGADFVITSSLQSVKKRK